MEQGADHAFLRVYLRLVSGYPRGAPECHMVSVYSVKLCDHVPGGEPSRFTSSGGTLPEFYTGRVPPYVLAPPGLTAYLFGCEVEALICCSRKEEPIVVQQYIPVQCITPLAAAEVKMQMTSGRFDKKTLRPPTISQVLTHYCAKARDKSASLASHPCTMSEVYARTGKWMRREENYIRMAYEYGQKKMQKRSTSSYASNRSNAFQNDPIKELFQRGLPTPCMGFKNGSSQVLPWKVLATRNYRHIAMPRECTAGATTRSACIPRPVTTHAIAEMFCGQERSPTHRQLFEVVNQLAVVARGEEHTEQGPVPSPYTHTAHNEQCANRYRAYNLKCIDKVTEALSVEDSGLATTTITTVSPSTFLQHMRYETYAVGLDENCLVLATVYGWQVLCGSLDRRTFKALAYAMVQGHGIPVTSIRFAADAMRPGYYLSPAVMSAISSQAKYVDSSPAWHVMSVLEDHALPVERPASRRDVLWDAHCKGFGRHAVPDVNSPTYALLSECGWVTAPSRGGVPAQPRSRLGSAGHIVSRTLSTTKVGSSSPTPSTRLETYLSEMHAALAIAQHSHRDNVYVITLTDADCSLLRTLREYTPGRVYESDNSDNESDSDAVCCYEQELMGLGLMRDVSRGQFSRGNSCNIATLSVVADALLRVDERERTLNFEKVFQKTLGVPQKVPEVIFYGAHMSTFHELACVFDCASAIVSAINYTRMRTRSIVNKERPRPPKMCVASTHVAIVTLVSPVVQHFWTPFNCPPTSSHMPTEAALAEIASSWLVHKVEPKNRSGSSSMIKTSKTTDVVTSDSRTISADENDRDVLEEINCVWSEEELTDSDSVGSCEFTGVQDECTGTGCPYIPITLADAWLMSVTMEDSADAVSWDELPVLAIYDTDLEDLSGNLGYYSDGPSSIAQETDAYLERGGIHGGTSSDTHFEAPLLYGGSVSSPTPNTITHISPTTRVSSDHDHDTIDTCDVHGSLFPLNMGAEKQWSTGGRGSPESMGDTGLGLHCTYQGPDSEACSEFLRRVGIHTGDNVQASPGAYARLSVGEHVYLPETGDIGTIVKIIRPYNSSIQTLGWHCDPRWETDKASLWCENEIRSRTIIAIQGPPMIDIPGAAPDMRAIEKATGNFDSFSVHHGESSCCSRGIHGDTYRRACDWIKAQGWPGVAKNSTSTSLSCEESSCATSCVFGGDDDDSESGSDVSDDCSLEEPIREKLPTQEEVNANASMLYTGMGPGAGVTMVAAGPHHVIVGSVMVRSKEYRGPTLRTITLLLFPGFTGEDIVAAAVKCIELKVIVIIGPTAPPVSLRMANRERSRTLLVEHKNAVMRIALSEYMKKGSLSPSGAIQTVTSTRDRRTNRRALVNQFSL